MTRISNLSAKKLCFLHISVSVLIIFGSLSSSKLLKIAKATTPLSEDIARMSSSTTASQPNINASNIQKNTEDISNNANEINNNSKEIGKNLEKIGNNDRRIQDNANFIKQFLTLVIVGAIASRLVDQIISEKREKEILKSLKENAKEEILPALVEEAVSKGTLEIRKKSILIEQEIFFMQYELLDLSLTQFDLERKSSLHGIDPGKDIEIDKNKIIRTIEYSIRAVEILNKLENHAEFNGKEEVRNNIHARKYLSFENIFCLIQKIKEPTRLELDSLKNEIQRLIDSNPEDILTANIIGEIVDLINLKYSKTPLSF